MARYAVIENDKVKIVTETTSEFAASKGWIAAANARPGDDYVGGEFVAPTPTVIVPESVTKFQAKAALINAGLLDDFETFMSAETTPELSKLAWKEAPNFNRYSPLLIAMASDFGLTNQQLDELFIYADTVVV